MKLETLNSPLYPITSIRILHDFLAEFGFDPSPALDASGFSGNEFTELNTAISGQQELNFQRAFMEITGYRPDLWLRAGLRYRAPAFGWLGLVMLTASDMTELVSIPTRHLFSYSLCATHPILVEGQLIGEELDSSGTVSEMHDFAVLHAVGAIISVYSDLWGGRFPFSEICIALPRPEHQISGLVPHPVRFGAERTLFHWRPEVSKRALPMADPQLHRIMLDHLQTLLRSTRVGDDFLVRLKAIIAQEDGFAITVGELAKAIGLTPRTLQRRLEERGLNFRGLVDRMRRERAMQLLLATELPIANIAFEVGFSDVTAFEHAFRRWTGATPRHFRASPSVSFENN